MIKKGKNVKIAENVVFIEKDAFPIILEDNVVIRSGSVIYWGCNFSKNVKIGHNAIIREFTEIGTDSVVGSLSDIEGYTKIGERTTIHSQCFIASTSIIMNDVFLGPGTVLTNTKRIKHGRDYPLVEKGPLIKNFVRVGARSLILPNITLNEDCLIAAGSIVTKDVDAGVVMMGIQAKVSGTVNPDEFHPHNK